MFSNIKNAYRMLAGKEEEVQHTTIVFVRVGAKIDTPKLETIKGICVIEGESIQEGVDYKFVEPHYIATTTLVKQIEKKGNV